MIKTGFWVTFGAPVRQDHAGAFQALLEEAIAEAARRDEIDKSLVRAESTTDRAHHDAAGMRVSDESLAALGRQPREKGSTGGQGGRRAKATRPASNADVSAAGGGRG
ncbi:MULTISPECIES: hypothetical protein [Streptomyces]|uniref:hypothetical protein n=1 Tax=Streptomyces TaxID=1883 RepID=UPI0035DE542E